MGSSQIKKRSRFSSWIFELDRILRGEATRPADIQQADIKIPVVGVAFIVILLAMIYGFCMGIFALVRGVESSQYQQALLQTFASMCKVPLLFFLTLVVTFPSLYVFNALVGSRLRVVPVLKLLVASLAVNLAVLASMGPILAFFSVSTPNYPFIVLLNVVVFAVAGVLGLVFLIQTLNRLSIAEQSLAEQAPRLPSEQMNEKTKKTRLENDATVIAATPTEPLPAIKATSSSEKVDLLRPESSLDQPARHSSLSPKRSTGPLDRLEGIVLGRHVRKVFTCWIVVFGLVGAQMGWVLRPFIGTPSTPFQWFRTRHSNFFEAVFNTFYELLF